MSVSTLLYEDLFQQSANSTVSRYSNLGSSNPYKGPTARSLFYDAGKYIPGKYGQFLLYSLGNYENDFINAYYRSEDATYNKSISSIESKNPSAGFLVRDSYNTAVTAQSTKGTLANISPAVMGNIIGGVSAPYYWKDFLYCKYYGTIPNNYMVTLRRFPTPMLDNLSVPDVVKNRLDGAAKPVAQAVTWFGGNTGNSLSNILTFSTGIEWESRTQENIKEQMAMAQGLFQSGPFKWFGSGIKSLGEGVENTFDVLGAIVDATIAGTDPNETTTRNLRTKGLRDRAKEQGGVMGEYIWTPVDVVKETYVRTTGLTFNWSQINVVFEYELASVGEVNSKAAMLDILGNLLAIGTNYGNFLTPDIRFKYDYPIVAFPGGQKGLETYYQDPLAWFIKFGKEISSIANPGVGGSTADSDAPTTIGDVEGVRQQLVQILKNTSSGKGDFMQELKTLAKNFGPGLGRVLRLAVTQEFLENFQAPISLLSGAPIGEWHLTVGNPCNPIAMIGNLICKDVKIEFSENLGPDDFPTGIKATFTLEHGRHRERGEIESIFNRGDGRLYQSTLETAASSQSYDSFVDVLGNPLSEQLKDNYLNNSTVWQGIDPELRALLGE